MGLISKSECLTLASLSSIIYLVGPICNFQWPLAFDGGTIKLFIYVVFSILYKAGEFVTISHVYPPPIFSGKAVRIPLR
jgi:hypothetical protein